MIRKGCFCFLSLILLFGAGCRYAAPSDPDNERGPAPVAPRPFHEHVDFMLAGLHRQMIAGDATLNMDAPVLIGHFTWYQTRISGPVGLAIENEVRDRIREHSRDLFNLVDAKTANRRADFSLFFRLPALQGSLRGMNALFAAPPGCGSDQERILSVIGGTYRPVSRNILQINAAAVDPCHPEKSAPQALVTLNVPFENLPPALERPTIKEFKNRLDLFDKMTQSTDKRRSRDVADVAAVVNILPNKGIGAVYSSDEPIRYSVVVNQPLYVLAVEIGELGNVRVLFPNKMSEKAQNGRIELIGKPVVVSQFEPAANSHGARTARVYASERPFECLEQLDWSQCAESYFEGAFSEREIRSILSGSFPVAPGLFLPKSGRGVSTDQCEIFVMRSTSPDMPLP